MRTYIATFFAFICILFASNTGMSTEIYVSDFGAIGDGITDDGPAIKNAFHSLLGGTGDKTLIFDEGKQYYIKNIGETYLFQVNSQSDITFEGNGCIFLLDGSIRFINAQKSKNITLKNLSIDYKPLPFVEGKMTTINQSENYIDVVIDDYFDIPPMGGASNIPGEQSYFGLVWYEGPNSLLSSHFYFSDMYEPDPGSSNRKVRLTALNFNDWGKISEGGTISIPVQGIAHVGGDDVMKIVECRNLKAKRIDIWTAPWFAIGLTRNYGKVEFNQVNVMPRPDTKRILSSWRDGIHVKSNYARLLFDDCRLEGMGDDAFNIATFMSSRSKISVYLLAEETTGLRRRLQPVYLSMKPFTHLLYLPYQMYCFRTTRYAEI